MKRTGILRFGFQIAVITLTTFAVIGCFAPFAEVPLRPGNSFTTSLSVVSDIVPGTTGSDPEWLTEYNGKLLFAADDPTAGRELFSYNGSALSLIDDLNPGAGDSNPEGLIEYKGDIYFAATTPATGYEVWRYTGSAVESVGEIDPGVNDGIFSFNPVVFEDHLFFEGYAPAGDRELYYYHPDFVAPQLFEDVNAGAVPSYPADFAVLNGVLYFYAETTSYGAELYRLAGVDQNVQVAAYIAGATTNLLPRDLIVYDGKLYFIGNSNYTSPVDDELWVYDPNETGPANTRGDLVESIRGTDDQVTDLWVANGTLYLRASDGIGWELYTYDGTSIEKLDANNDTSPAYPNDLVEYGGEVYYSAAGPKYGDEVWKLKNGVPTPVTDAVPGTGDAFPGELTVVGNDLYMYADFPDTGYEIYRLKSGL